jgi:NAD+ synthase
MPVVDTDALIRERVGAIRALHDSIRNHRAELDVSGGVDSAVMLGLLARAVGADHVTAVYSSIHSSDDSRRRAQMAADAFGVSLVKVELTDVYESLITEMKAALVVSGWSAENLEQRIAEDPTILGSIRSCLRAPVGRGFNRLSGGGIRHGTGNECEDRWLRFYQKGGDGEVDTNPINMLAKGEVFQLAVALGVPDEIVGAVPTPDLWGVGERHSDEDELLAITGVPFTYTRVDPATGQYLRVGTIERVSRFADTEAGVCLFDDALSETAFDQMGDAATESSIFAGLDECPAGPLLQAARRVERVTRHKANPNCPGLGDRGELLAAGVLTDDLWIASP